MQKVLTYLDNLEWPNHVGGKHVEHLLRVQGAQCGVGADACIVDEQAQALVLQMIPHSPHGSLDAGQIHCVCQGKCKVKNSSDGSHSTHWKFAVAGTSTSYPERMQQV